MSRAVLVTGASGGLGAAIARAFACAGDTVMVHYATDAERARTVVDELPGTGHAMFGADVSAPEQAQRLVDATVEGLGGLDVVVNNAGTAAPEHPVDCSFEQWQQAWQHIISVNLLGAAYVSHCAIPRLRQRRGRIVNVGSRAAYRGMPTAPAYAASKAALHAFGQSLAVAVGNDGISVTTVAPGVVDAGMGTPFLRGEVGEAIRNQSPFHRVATAEEVAAAVLYLASPEAEFASGAVLDLNGASYLR
ncbi:SDR family NAD(P)-dependent oxidoreductase [Allokutzneria albata]|nr:SDR family oxidoreductase [Allokutzneria albata]